MNPFRYVVSWHGAAALIANTIGSSTPLVQTRLKTLSKDQTVTVTGELRHGDFMRAPGTARIMNTCWSE